MPSFKAKALILVSHFISSPFIFAHPQALWRCFFLILPCWFPFPRRLFQETLFQGSSPCVNQPMLFPNRVSSFSLPSVRQSLSSFLPSLFLAVNPPCRIFLAISVSCPFRKCRRLFALVIS